MPDPANLIADVMFLHYTGGKPFPRGLHEKTEDHRKDGRKKKIQPYTRFQSDNEIPSLSKPCGVLSEEKPHNRYYSTSCNIPVQLS